MTIVISGETFGKGPEVLGKTLLKNYIYTLSELSQVPKEIIFINTGVYVTVKDSNAFKDLQKLEEKGTKILICGSCVDYYSLQEVLAVGTVSNMTEIVTIMARADQVIHI
ncbi:MAG: sulfurtransferase-like selenium metabolism protein YedF [Lachnospiraceae bacterium]|nr:sulfurtransferase-like selenium metabolism protein YedF [Lachnospiraceae bacterium]